MNTLKMDVKHSIQVLFERDWSQRRIARELGIDRETVKRYSKQLEKEEVSPPDGLGGSKPAKTIAGKRSDSEAFDTFISSGLEQGLTAQRIWQDLVGEKGFTGSYQSVKRYVQRLREKSPQRFWRMETLPAEEVQVDFCTGYWLKDEKGRKRKVHVFRMVLSHSRKAYSQAVLHQDTESFLRCLENGFRYFGGVTATTNLDNLKAAVLQADWYDPTLNPKMVDFARFYDTAILPCKPRIARHKGKVENSIGYVQKNALAGKCFSSLSELNAHLQWWEKNVADLRIHGTTRKQVQALFELEKPSLKALPMGLFPCFQEVPRMVHRDSYVEVARSYYEVPPEHIGRRLWVRWDGRMVRIFTSNLELIITHPQGEPGSFSKALGCQGRPCVSIEESHRYYVQKVSRLGVHAQAWAEGTWEARGPISIRLLQGLLSQAKNYRASDLDQACRKALDSGQWKLRDVRYWLDHPQVIAPTFSFLESHPLIRDMADYQNHVGPFEEADSLFKTYHDSQHQPTSPSTPIIGNAHNP